VAMLIVGSFLGAGFASGKEFVELFDSGGKVSIVMPIVMAVLVFLISVVCLKIASKMLKTSVGRPIGINEFLLKKYTVFGDLFMLVNSFVLMAIMISTVDNVGYAYGLRFPSLGTICVALVSLVVLGGVGRLLKVNNIVCPILILLLIVTYIFGIQSFDGLSLSKGNVISNTMGAVGYVCFNIYLSIKVITKQRLLTNRQILLSSAIAGVIIGIFMSIIILAISVDSSVFYSDLPLIAIAAQYGTITKVIAGIILIVCAMNTLMIAFFSIFEWMDFVPNKIVRGLIIATIGLGISSLGYANIILYIYPSLSVISVIFMTLIVIKLISLKYKETRSGQNHLKRPLPNYQL